MTIQNLTEKYNLQKSDFWEMEIKNKNKKVIKTIYMVSHDAIERIAIQENIELIEIKVLNSEIDLVRFLISMRMKEKIISSVGEADRKNCKSQYLGCMAEKRGIDRCVLKLINAYQYGIYSEVEADSFSRVEKPEKKETQIEKEQKLGTIIIANGKNFNYFEYKNLSVEKLQEFLKELQKNQHPQTAEVAEYLRKKILEES